MPTALSIYLNDHLAAAAGGAQLARRARDAHAGGDAGLEQVLADVTVEIEADEEELHRIMGLLDVRRDRVKQTLGGLAERLGRLKANGRIIRRSPLSSLVELEGLTIATAGKRAGWRALQQLDDARLRSVDLQQLVERAESQHERVDRQRLIVASKVLGAAPGGP